MRMAAGRTLIALPVLLLATLFFTRLAINLSAAPMTTTPLLYTIADRYVALAWMQAADRFPTGATVMVRDSRGRRPLARNFAASADPAISFDGKTALFAAKRNPDDHWQIWEISFAGGQALQLTSCPDDCIRPFYLPANRIVYARKAEGRFVIESATLVEGKVASPTLRLTYTPENAIPSDILRDGRILFSSSTAEGAPELYTVYSDGSGVESYRCDHGNPRFAGRQVNSGDIIFATPQGLGRFTSARAEQLNIAGATGEYSGDVAETALGDWLLSWRPDNKTPFQLAQTVEARAPSGAIASARQAVVVEPGVNVLQPTPVSDHAPPKRHPSGLHDWSYANLLCLNAYTSKYKLAPASIHAIRLYTRDAAGNAQLLGTAPVEKDGSFFVQVPGDRPIQIELLDDSGQALRREKGWFWMRQGEQRICVGCHAGPETAPENAVPMILQRSTTPTDLTGVAPQHASGGH